jgi:hypothetical protein
MLGSRPVLCAQSQSEDVNTTGAASPGCGTTIGCSTEISAVGGRSLR